MSLYMVICLRNHLFEYQRYQIHTFDSMFYLIALIVIVAAGLMLMLVSKRQPANDDGSTEEKDSTDVQSDCCGTHEVCEFEEYRYNEEVIEYFDDEDLDVLRNVRQNELTPANIDELRDVLYSLKAAEINRWLTSLSRRHIHLPEVLQQEARQLIAEEQ